MKRTRFTRGTTPFLWLLLSIVLVFAACSKDNDESSEAKPEPAPDSTIELPTDANITVDDLTVLGDGEQMQVSSDGTFNSTPSSLMAFNGEDIVYMSYGNGNEERVLGPQETAIALLLPAIPFSTTDLNERQLRAMKLMIAHLEPTKDLVRAIEKSVADDGYLNMDAIDSQLRAAIKELDHRFGMDEVQAKLRNRVEKRKMMTRGSGTDVPSFPYFVTSNAKKTQYDGYTITLTDATLLEENGEKYWHCKFNLLNADRFCYTSITKAYRTKDNMYGRIDNSFTDTFRHLIKPMNVSAFMDWGTLSDVVLEPEHFLTALSDPDFDRVIDLWWTPIKNAKHFIMGEELETMTFDKIQLNDIEFDFKSPNEHLMIVGPGFDGDLLMFNIVKIFFQPVLKMVLGEVKKTDGYEKSSALDQFVVDFVEWMSKADLKFRAELLQTFTDPEKSWGERFDLLFDKLSERVEKFCVDYAIDKFSEGVSGIIAKRLGSVPMEAYKKVFTLFKTTLTAGDILLFMLDSNYNGFGMQIEQGFSQTNGGLDNVPGSDL